MSQDIAATYVDGESESVLLSDVVDWPLESGEASPEMDPIPIEAARNRQEDSGVRAYH